MNEASLTYLQRYVLNRQEKYLATTMFNLAKMYKLRRGIDLEKLANSLAMAGRSHQALLSTLHKFPNGEVLQRQELDEEDIQVEIVKVPERNLLARRASYVKIFDLLDDGLVDAVIFDCGVNSYLLSNIHHLVCDGYSFPLILDDAHRVWNGEEIVQDNYYEILHLRNGHMNTPMALATRNFIKELLRSKHFTSILPRDCFREAGCGTYEVELSIPEDFDKFLALRRATRHHVFLAASALALARMTDSEDVLIDWVFHGRISKDELRTVGAFMVDLPLIFEGISTLTASDIITNVKQSTFRGIKNTRSISSIDDMNPNGDERLTFIYQDRWGELMTPGIVDPEGPFAWMIEETISLRQNLNMAENPMNVEIMEHKDSTKLFLEYDSGRYREETIRRYADEFQRALTWLVN